MEGCCVLKTQFLSYVCRVSIVLVVGGSARVESLKNVRMDISVYIVAPKLLYFKQKGAVAGTTSFCEQHIA